MNTKNIYSKNDFPKQINVDKEDYSIIQMIGGQYKIAKGWNSNPVYGGDSACEDHYNKEIIDTIYNNWNGELFWNGEKFSINQ